MGNRREFLKTAAGVSIALGAGAHGSKAGGLSPHGGASPPIPPLPPQEPALFRAPPIETVRIGFVGVGHQGSGHVSNFLRIDGVEVAAICDIVPAKVARMQARVVEAGRPRPAAYDRGPDDYIRMCEEAELDLVFTATPWRLHAPVCLAAMRNGKHAATEVPMRRHGGRVLGAGRDRRGDRAGTA
jgi:hypothetical protein